MNLTMQRMLVGLDGSALAETILGTARVLAGRLGAEVVLLHVVHVPESFRAEADLTLDGVVLQERRAAESHLRRVARELADAGIKTETAVVVGDPAVEIARPRKLHVGGAAETWSESMLAPDIAPRAASLGDGRAIAIRGAPSRISPTSSTSSSG